MSTVRKTFKDPIIDRLMRRIKKTDTCWIWAPKSGRYGMFYNEGKFVLAHRAVYEAMVGPIQEGLVLDHLCSQKYCVNPEHLEAVTQKVNAQRYFSSLTECKHGHAFTSDNTLKDKRGHRVCRTYKNEHQRQYSLRMKGAL